MQLLHNKECCHIDLFTTMHHAFDQICNQIAAAKWTLFMVSPATYTQHKCFTL